MKQFTIILSALLLLLFAGACSASKDEQTIGRETVQESNIIENVTGDVTTVYETATVETTVSEPLKSDSSVKTSVNLQTTQNVTKAPAKNTPAKKITVNDLRIGMTVKEDTVTALGTVIDKQNAPSCHFDGNDTIYCYNGFTLYTYMNNGAQKLYLIEIDSSSVKTSKGASIGMSVDQVKGLYGSPEKETGTSIVYNENGANVRFTFNSSNTITLIEYEE